MKRLTIFAILAAGSSVPALPAVAQQSGGTLVIFGNDRCPTDSQGNEIVVCVRKPAEDRFRIPKTIREQSPAEIPPDRQSWAVRQQDAMTAGATGTGSCSTVGPGGFTGCFVQEATAAKKEYKARKADLDNLPLP